MKVRFNIYAVTQPSEKSTGTKILFQYNNYGKYRGLVNLDRTQYITAVLGEIIMELKKH